MKHKFFLVTFFLILSTFLFAQKNNRVKLYGFKQPVLPGAAKARDINEDGSVTKKTSGAAYNYKMYLTAPAGISVYPVAIWLKGQVYGAQYEAVDQTPVTVTNYTSPNHPQTAVLVPKTTQKVLSLAPIPSVENKNPAKAKALAAANELVVQYKMKGKFYYAALKQMTELEPQAMQ